MNTVASILVEWFVISAIVLGVGEAVWHISVDTWKGVSSLMRKYKDSPREPDLLQKDDFGYSEYL